MRREWVCLALVCAAAAGQGIATRNVEAGRARKGLRAAVDVAPDQYRRPGGTDAPTVYGAESNVQYLVETSGGGVALFDYDGDGWTDIFIVGGTRFEDAPAGADQPPLPQSSATALSRT